MHKTNYINKCSIWVNILCALLVVAGVTIGAESAVKAFAQTYNTIEEAVETKNVVYLYQGAASGKKAVFAELKSGVKWDFSVDQTSSVKNIAQISYSITAETELDIDELVEIHNGVITFTGSDKAMKKLLGERVDIKYTLRANDLSTKDYTLELWFVEDSYAIDGRSSQLIGEGESETVNLFTGSREFIEAAWTSSNPEIISVEAVKSDKGYSAVITGKKTGTATITATIKTDSAYTAVSREYTVNWKPGKGVLNFEKVTLLTGEKVQLLPSDIPEKSKVTYSSNKKSVASVDSKTGMITAKKAGKATVTATIKAPKTQYAPSSTYKIKCTVTVKKAGKVTDVSNAKELAAAFGNGKGGSIRLIKDIKDFNTTVTVNSGEYRFDLNGHSITGNGLDKSGLIMVNGGTLYVLDTKGKGTMANLGGQEALGCKKGKLYVFGGGYAAVSYCVCIEGGNVKLYGGTFNGMSRAILMLGGNLSVYGGKYVNTEDYDSAPWLYFYDALDISADAKSAVINGGTFEGCGAVSVNAENAKVEINHGSFIADVDGVCVNSGELTINGGSFGGSSEDSCNIVVRPIWSDAAVTINGGLFDCSLHNLSAQNESYVFVNGGIFTQEDLGWDNPAVKIYDTLCGVVQIAAGVIPEKDINDETPAGRKLIATTFTDNGTKYKPGMVLKTPDDAYSAFNDACDNLYKHFEFYCDKDIYNIINYYAVDYWMEYRHGNVDAAYDFDSTKKMYVVTFDMDYATNYALDKISKNPAAAKNASKKVNAYSDTIDDILKSCIKKGMSDKEKVTAIHDYMCRAYKYDYTFKSASYTVEGLLDNKTGVCQAYALLFKTLCRRAGIECDTIEGFAGAPGEEGLHMWNRVYIDGKALYCDVTFDDSASTTRWLLKDEKTFYGYGYHY